MLVFRILVMEIILMRRLSPWFGLTYFFLAGCSYLSGVGDFFDRDENKQDAKELAAKVAKTAGENSESPESAVTDLVLEEGSAKLSKMGCCECEDSYFHRLLQLLLERSRIF